MSKAKDDTAKTKAELATIAAGIAEQLDKLTPEDAKRVLAIVETLRTKPALALPHFAPPSEPPLRTRRADFPGPRSGLIS